MIGQVFLNLLNNSIEAINEIWRLKIESPASYNLSPPSILVRTETISHQWVHIIIEDTGIGIADDIKHRVYEPFFSTKPVGEGKGLGLTMSYRIITEIHHGKLSFETQPGQGTQFRVELPIETTA